MESDEKELFILGSEVGHSFYVVKEWLIKLLCFHNALLRDVTTGDYLSGHHFYNQKRKMIKVFLPSPLTRYNKKHQ